MKYLILIALVSISTARAAQHNFGNGNCRGCGGEWSKDPQTGLMQCTPGPAGPLEICGDANMGPKKVVANPLIGGGTRKAVTAPANYRAR